MKRISMFLSDIQIKRLKALSKLTGLKVSEMVRRAVDEYLDKEGK